MPQSPTALVLSLAQGVHRLTLSAPLASLRLAVTHLSAWSLAGAARPTRATAAPLEGALSRLLRAAKTLYVLARHGDIRVREAATAREAELVEARLVADHWRGRAEADAARVAELEVRLAESEMTALDLRSRLVCLHGKLATTTATARYQTLALALEHQLPSPPPAAMVAALAVPEGPRA